ncbi:MAG: DUF2267 domain-containing protein [Micromonosporaceae bacterium]
MSVDSLVAGVRRRLDSSGADGDYAQAVGVLRTVLRVVGEHLPAGEAALLAAALPDEVAPEVRHPGPPSTWDGARSRTPLLAELAARLGTDEPTAQRRLAAVLDALAEAVPLGVLYRAEVALPSVAFTLNRSRAS